jgi:hypothetical protein
VGLWDKTINPLNAELNFICHLLTLLGPHPILHVSRIRINTAQNNQVKPRSPQYTYVSHRLPLVSADIHTVYEDTRKHVEIGKDICLK